MFDDLLRPPLRVVSAVAEFFLATLFGEEEIRDDDGVKVGVNLYFSILASLVQAVIGCMQPNSELFLYFGNLLHMNCLLIF